MCIRDSYGTTRNYWDVPLPLPELWEAVKWAVKPNGAVLFLSLIHIFPFRSGFEICKELKAKQIGTVLVLTARDKLQDELHALDSVSYTHLDVYKRQERS